MSNLVEKHLKNESEELSEKIVKLELKLQKLKQQLENLELIIDDVQKFEWVNGGER